MNELIKSISNLAYMWFYGALGDIFVILGIVSEVKDIELASISPLVWFLLAVVCYMGMLWVVALNILVRLHRDED